MTLDDSGDGGRDGGRDNGRNGGWNSRADRTGILHDSRSITASEDHLIKGSEDEEIRRSIPNESRE